MDKLDRESEKILQNVYRISNAMVDRLNGVSRFPIDLVYAYSAYLSFFIRNVRLFRAFRTLVGLGYGTEAELLLRPLCDTLVDWLYIETDPEVLGERYLMYESAYKLEICRRKGSKEQLQNYLSTYGDAKKEFCFRYSNNGKGKLPSDWSGLKPAEKSKQAGLSDYYDLYGLYSAFLHNNPISVSNYIDTSNKNCLFLKTEPDFNELGKMIGIACNVMIFCIKKADEYFKLEVQIETTDLESKLIAYNKYIEGANS
ncbi:MAG: DUF5677 domain-containing protein [Armatimonadota bacterium]